MFSSDLLKLFSQYILFSLFNELRSLDLLFKITFDTFLVCVCHPFNKWVRPKWWASMNNWTSIKCVLPTNYFRTVRTGFCCWVELLFLRIPFLRTQMESWKDIFPLLSAVLDWHSMAVASKYFSSNSAWCFPSFNINFIRLMLNHENTRHHISKRSKPRTQYIATLKTLELLFHFQIY